MKPDVMLGILEGVAQELGIKVSYETLQSSVGNGGLCRVKGVYRVIIEKRATSEERVNTLAAALGGFDTSQLALPKAARELLRLNEGSGKVRRPAA